MIGTLLMHILNSYEPSLPTSGIHTITLMVVLTQDAEGLKAVYWGANCSKEYAAMHGTKLNYLHAVMYFPGLKKEEYRT